MTLTLTTLQREGVEFLTTLTPAGKPHKLLADAPGVGKTVEACAAIKRVNATSGLIICPDPEVIKNSWKRHLIDWAGVPEHGIHIVRNSIDPIPAHASFIIVGYALVRYDRVFDQLSCYRYGVVVVDEAKRLKALDSKTSQRILGGGDRSLISRGYWKWLLDGTIMPNRPMELYPMLKTLAPEVITPYLSVDDFGKRYCGGMDPNTQTYRGASNEAELRERLKAFMLCRTLEQAFPDFADIETIETDLFVDIGDLPSGADETNTAMATLRREIGIAKIPYILEYIQYRQEREPEQKILCFTFHREVIEQLVNNTGLATCRMIYGGMTTEEKGKALTQFLRNPDIKILYAQINSAGEGIDGLQQVCNNIVCAEPDWSGGGYEQMIGRLRRYGQTKPVNVTLVLAEKTLDETIAAVRRRKQKTIGKLITPILNQIEKDGTLMSLESILERIAVALETLAADEANANGSPVEQALTPPTPITAAAKPTKPKTGAGTKTTIVTPEAKTYTTDEVREAAKKALLALGNTEDARAKIKAVMQKFNVETLADLDPTHYADAVQLYGALEKGEPATGEDSLGI